MHLETICVVGAIAGGHCGHRKHHCVWIWRFIVASAFTVLVIPRVRFWFHPAALTSTGTYTSYLQRQNSCIGSMGAIIEHGRPCMWGFGSCHGLEGRCSCRLVGILRMRAPAQFVKVWAPLALHNSRCHQAPQLLLKLVKLTSKIKMCGVRAQHAHLFQKMRTILATVDRR